MQCRKALPLMLHKRYYYNGPRALRTTLDHVASIGPSVCIDGIQTSAMEINGKCIKECAVAADGWATATATAALRRLCESLCLFW